MFDASSITLSDLEADPDPILAHMREESPVCWVPALDMWFVTRWDDVIHVDAHPEVFSAATEPSFLARALGPNMMTADPPESSRVRAAMLPSFQPRGVSGDFVRDRLSAMADDLIDALPATVPDSGSLDLMAAFAEPLAAGSLAEVLGLSDHGADAMWRWCLGLCADIANFEDDPERRALGDAAKAELGSAIQARLDDFGRSESGTSALRNFLDASLSEAEIVNNVRLMISGGINEPRDGIGLVVWVLLTRPDLLERVRVEPERWGRLVEEIFRRYSPVGTITRQATRDVELGGVEIPAGTLVSGILRSANLDEYRFANPLEIDLDRSERGHAAFATGAHRCLGEWLGRQEVRLGARRLIERLVDVELAGPVELHGFEFRGPRTLPLRWSRVAPRE